MHDERRIANQQRLNKTEQDILIAAATEIAKKRKDFSEWLENNMALQIAITLCC